MQTSPHTSGYRIQRVYVADQTYKIVPEEGLLEGTAPVDRQANFGWDWRPISSRVFEVVIEISIAPIKEAPEQMSVRLIGIFSAGKGELSIPFPQFVRRNAPAILFPYAREVISTMSGRGPHGAFHLHPLNVSTLTSGFDLSQTTGTAFLDANPDFARDFGLDYRPESKRTVANEG